MWACLCQSLNSHHEKPLKHRHKHQPENRAYQVKKKQSFRNRKKTTTKQKQEQKKNEKRDSKMFKKQHLFITRFVSLKGMHSN